MKKDEIYFVDRENIQNLGIDDGFLNKKSQYMIFQLKEKKTMKKKTGNLLRYKWLYMVMPNTYVDFCEHDIKIEDEELYENSFTTPVSEEHITMISNENFLYEQMEIEERLK